MLLTIQKVLIQNVKRKEKLTEENIEIKKNEKKIFNVTFQEKNNKDKILSE